jgi:hypothetical protein
MLLADFKFLIGEAVAQECNAIGDRALGQSLSRGTVQQITNEQYPKA